MSARVDAWVWSVRLAKTRSAAGAACRGGHVKVNGTTAKPATTIVAGDEIRITGGPRLRIVVVTQPIVKRVGAAVAVGCYIDKSPPPPEVTKIAPVALRDRGTGRPTKRERREIERLRGREQLESPAWPGRQ